MSPRTIAVAVDGMEPSLLDRYLQAGVLPNVERLRSRGSYGTAACSSLSSAKQWATHFAGVSPDCHGITGFTRRSDGRRAGDDAPQARELVTLSDLAVRTYPEVLSDRGVSVGLVNPLLLWPPLELGDGYCISGMLTPPATDRWVAPASLGAELEDLGYRIDIRYGNRPYGFVDDALFDEVGLDALETDLFEVLDARIAATKHLVTTRETEFLYVLIKSIDVFQHCFWAQMVADDPTFGDVIRRAYQRVDDLLGWLDANTEANIIAFSDHGFQARSEARVGPLGSLARAIDEHVTVPEFVASAYDRIAKTDVGVARDSDRTTGDHADPATWFAAGPAVTASGRVDVRFEDLTPTIFALLDQPIPEGYVGEPVDSVTLDPGSVESSLEVDRHLDIDPDDIVTERLHNLGYAEMVDE